MLVRITCAVGLAILVAGGPARSPGNRDPMQPSGASLKAILGLAAEWVQRFADEGTFVVADERYDQAYRHPSGSGWQVERRALRSEVVIVRTPPDETRRGFPWVQFRDVQEVDGQTLADHEGRLERLFRDPSGASYGEARALVEESARFNIGPAVRTVNVPALALFFLVPQNQRRFRFEWKSEETIDGVRAAVVRYRERERPTIVRGPNRQDRPANGAFWIDPATGRVMRSRLEVDAERHWTSEIEVDYGRDARLDLWTAMAMRERHVRDSGESVNCTAAYSNFRRFETTARMVVPR